MKDKGTPKQCYEMGGQVADLLFNDPTIDRQLLQKAIEDDGHAFWTELRPRFQFHFGMKGDESRIVPAISPLAPAWRRDAERNIRFTITSKRLTRKEWAEHATYKGWEPHSRVRYILQNARNEPTGNVTYRVVVRPVHEFKQRELSVDQVRDYATSKGWKKPHWELACLIRDTFTYDQISEMGISSIVTMHKPVKDRDKEESEGARPTGFWVLVVGCCGNANKNGSLDASLAMGHNVFNHTTAVAFIE